MPCHKTKRSRKHSQILKPKDILWLQIVLQVNIFNPLCLYDIYRSNQMLKLHLISTFPNEGLRWRRGHVWFWSPTEPWQQLCTSAHRDREKASRWQQPHTRSCSLYYLIHSNSAQKQEVEMCHQSICKRLQKLKKNPDLFAVRNTHHSYPVLAFCSKQNSL